MSYSVEDVVKKLDVGDSESEALHARLTQRRARAGNLIKLGEVLAASGEYVKAERAFRRALRIQPSLASLVMDESPFGNTPFPPPHPFDVAFQDDWQRYGFVDSREPGKYQLFVLENLIRERWEGKPETKLGYRYFSSPEEVLLKYPLDAFREWLMKSDS